MARGPFTVSDYITVPIAAIPYNSLRWTITLWCQSFVELGTGTYRLFHVAQNGSNVYGINILFAAQQPFYAATFTPNGTGESSEVLDVERIRGTDHSPQAAHEWDFLMLCRTAASEISFYVGNPRLGTIGSDADISHNLGTDSTFNEASIGLFRSNGTKTQPWPGKIAYVKVQDSAPDSFQKVPEYFLAHMASWENCIEKTTGAWKLDGSDPEPDETHYGRDGTIVGSPGSDDAQNLIIFDPAYGWAAARVPATMSVSPKVGGDMWVNEDLTIGDT